MKLIKNTILKVKTLISRYDRMTAEYGGVMNYSYSDAFRGSYM